MTKREKKKLIPRGTIYCDDCLHWKIVGEILYHRDPIKLISIQQIEEQRLGYPVAIQKCDETRCDGNCWHKYCSGEWSSSNCREHIAQCDYLHVQSKDFLESPLWDGIKICGIK